MSLENGQTKEQIAEEIKAERERLLSAEELAEKSRERIRILEERAATFGGELNFSQEVNKQVEEIDEEAKEVVVEAKAGIETTVSVESGPTTLEDLLEQNKLKIEELKASFKNDFLKLDENEEHKALLMKVIYYTEKEKQMLLNLDRNTRQELNDKEFSAVFKKIGKEDVLEELKLTASDYNDAFAEQQNIKNVESVGLEESFNDCLNPNKSFDDAGRVAMILFKIGFKTKEEIIHMFEEKITEHLKKIRDMDEKKKVFIPENERKELDDIERKSVGDRFGIEFYQK